MELSSLLGWNLGVLPSWQMFSPHSLLLQRTPSTTRWDETLQCFPALPDWYQQWHGECCWQWNIFVLSLFFPLPGELRKPSACSLQWFHQLQEGLRQVAAVQPRTRDDVKSAVITLLSILSTSSWGVWLSWGICQLWSPPASWTGHPAAGDSPGAAGFGNPLA